MSNPLEQMNHKEVELPETVFIRDIENKVFQSIVVQCLLNIEGIALLEGNLIDYFLGRESPERISGIFVEQDLKNQSIQVKIEVSVAFGIVLPQKAEEIQTLVAKELSRLTGLHVSLVHVVFKNLIKIESKEMGAENEDEAATHYSDNF
ncbi:Asp23/Gls24 family envelope stress response protein [Rhabdochlamydiaceae symbiont of Dictyostelium giganteum]|uniref:Asp23/Gls24 family envelope stress response protein n=1 Tax=Rhabdochlamydiaceae symbiont of Dictyostelium giganteum TaxID=3342349 RepID=UPI00384C4A4A